VVFEVEVRADAAVTTFVRIDMPNALARFDPLTDGDLSNHMPVYCGARSVLGRVIYNDPTGRVGASETRSRARMDDGSALRSKYRKSSASSVTTIVSSAMFGAPSGAKS
jgi:hypothetical protein